MKRTWGSLAVAFAFALGAMLPACSGSGGSPVSAGGKTATINLKIIAPSQGTAAKTPGAAQSREAHVRQILATTKSFKVSVTGAGIATPVTATANMGANGATLTLSGVPTGTARTFAISAWDTIGATGRVISFGNVVTDVYPGTNQIGINLYGVATTVTPSPVTLAVGPNGASTPQQFAALDKDGNYITNDAFITTGLTGGAGCTLKITATTAAAPFGPGPITAATVVAPGVGYHEGDLIALNDFTGTTGSGSGNALAQVASLVNTSTTLGVTTGGVGAVSILYPGTFYYSTQAGSGLKLNITAAAGPITAATVAAGFAGTGYALGDVLMVTGGNSDAKVQAATLGVGGAVATVNILQAGTGYATTGANPPSLTSNIASNANVATTAVWEYPLVEWKVNGNTPGNTANGAISQAGYYTPPAVMPASPAVTVSATPTASLALPPATAAVTLNGTAGGIAINIGGTVPPAPVISTSTLAPTPQGSVKVSWPAVTMPIAGSSYPITSYTVYWSKQADITSCCWVAGFWTGTQAIVSPLMGNKYYFVVLANNAQGSSAPSNVASATPVFTNILANLAYVPIDPLFGAQWHLYNSGIQLYADGITTAGATGIGNDLNVEPVWSTFRGTGVRIAVVDTGLDLFHEDLAANVAPNESYDYTLNFGAGAQVPPGANLLSVLYGASLFHGTAVAGLAAAVEGNAKGGVGVAPEAKLVGYNFLQYGTFNNMADTMIHGLTNNSIYTNSWGQQNGWGFLITEPASWQAAVDTGNATGRGGKGAIYTFAAGNGYPYDRSDYNGLANFRGVIAVGALTDTGTRASYSEQGSNLLVSAYAGNYCDTHTVTTTDIMAAAGINAGSTIIGATAFLDYADGGYTKCMNGTSAATPEVAGVAALMLQANPTLTWRDVRIILARTARQNDPSDITGWGTTAAGWGLSGGGHLINDNYGYGAVNALAAVNMALTWTSVGGSNTLKSITGPNPIITPIPINDGGAFGVYGVPITSTITLAGAALANTLINNIEFVEVTVKSDAPYDSDLRIRITSPSLTTSTLTVVRPFWDTSLSTGYTFGVARLIDEPANGVWTLTVDDGWVGGTGNLISWSVKAYGH